MHVGYMEGYESVHICVYLTVCLSVSDECVKWYTLILKGEKKRIDTYI